MIRFYSPDIAESPILPESDSAHCVRVLRMREGDELQAVDGRGMLYTLRLVDAHPKHAAVEIIGREEQPLPWRQQITIAVAPTKLMDRMEWLVEKLTEVGVNRIIPLRCRYSERKEIKIDRLEKIAISAMKQSLKAYLPEIWPMTPIKEALTRIQAEQKFVAYCADDVERRLLAPLYRPGVDVAMLIGPEGDFSHEEVEATLTAGYVPVSLGDNRLRTETAALYSCSAFHIIDDLQDGF